MITFRIACQQDAPAIAWIHATSWQRTYRGNFRDAFLDGDVFPERSHAWQQRLARPAANQFVHVAEEHNNIYGFICAFGGHDPQWGSFIDNLHVDKVHQGRGIGSGLMNAAASALSAQFATTPVHLLVWESNPARLFYERLGGHNTGQVDMQNPGGGSGLYFRMAWDAPHRIRPI